MIDDKKRLIKIFFCLSGVVFFTHLGCYCLFDGGKPREIAMAFCMYFCGIIVERVLNHIWRGGTKK